MVVLCFFRLILYIFIDILCRNLINQQMINYSQSAFVDSGGPTDI